jgi:hypothetical protein
VVAVVVVVALVVVGLVAVVSSVADPRGHLGRFLHPDIRILLNPHTWLNFQDCHDLVIGKTIKKSINSCFKSLSGEIFGVKFSFSGYFISLD